MQVHNIITRPKWEKKEKERKAGLCAPSLLVLAAACDMLYASCKSFAHARQRHITKHKNDDDNNNLSTNQDTGGGGR